MIRLVSLAAYVGSVIAANALVQRYGIVDVLPGPAQLPAPAAVYAVGFALVARDVLHQLDMRLVAVGIALGAALSAIVAEPRFVIASTAAFITSELLDTLIFAPLRRRGFARAALLSSAPAAVVDSAVFLWLAFGSLTFLPGQVVGKLLAIVVCVAALTAARTTRAVRTA